MEKFLELQIKMLITNQENVQNHNYASDPSEWPFLTRGIAYYISKKSNVSRDFILYLLDVFMKCRYILILHIVLIWYYVNYWRNKTHSTTSLVPISIFFQAQVHLLGNVVIWYTSSLGVLFYSTLLGFYLLRRRRLCFDISEGEFIYLSHWGKVRTTADNRTLKSILCAWCLAYCIFSPYLYVECRLDHNLAYS